LSLPLLGAIGRAGAFAFAGVLAPLLLIAAPVTLAGVQPLAERGPAFNRAIVPPSKPVKAATSAKEFFEIFVYTFLLPRFVGLQT
jgi:hypothetical protein